MLRLSRRMTVLFLLLAFATATTRAELIEEVVAWVNGEIITFSELEEEEENQTAEAYRRLQGEELKQWLLDARSRILLDMIDRKILVHHAQSLGFDLDEMGEAMLDNFKEQQGVTTDAEFAERLESEGLTIEAVKQRLIEMYAPQEVISFEVTNRLSVSDRDVESYYNDHSTQFAQAGDVTVREIVLLAPSDTKKAERRAELDAVLARLEAGEDFAAVAVELSEAGTSEQGGLLGPLKKQDLSAQLAAAAFTVPVGEISEVMETSYGFHLVKVESRTDASVLSLEEVREPLREKLMDAEFGKRISEFMTRLRSNSEWCVKPKYEHLLSIPARTECETI
jgi:parvulin-like peptidyl-prolyl isomerase